MQGDLPGQLYTLLLYHTCMSVSNKTKQNVTRDCWSL